MLSVSLWNHAQRRKVPPFAADFALVRRVSELESEIVTLEDQIAALTKELRWVWVQVAWRREVIQYSKWLKRYAR